MGTLLLVVGLIWAVIGGANILSLDWMNPAGSGIVALGLIFNMVLFIVPGLLLAGIGHHLGKRKAAPAAPPGTVEARMAAIRDLREAGEISQAEFDAKRAEIITTI